MTLRPALVLDVTEEAVTLADGVVPFAPFFPAPRASRVAPGNLVAVDDSPAVVWRWFDAVVVGATDEGVRLWEPFHGFVVARPRVARAYPPGSRAYLSAGLPGADWWVAGPAVAQASSASEADVELDELGEFLAGLR